jgi:hypothetical protein
MSQLMIKLHEHSFDDVSLAYSAVMIPPSGPSPGQRSTTQSIPKLLYFPASPTMPMVAPTAACKIRQSRAINGSPPNSANALSRPKRRLAPPASTNPATCPGSVLPVTSHLVSLLPHDNYSASSTGSRPGRRMPSSRNFSCKLWRCKPIVAAVRDTFQRWLASCFVR